MTEDILEPDLPIIDPHHHLWERRAARTGELPPPKHGFEAMLRMVPLYLFPELLADTTGGHNVIGTVYMECGAMYGQGGDAAFRADKGGVVHAPIGRRSFPAAHLAANFGALAAALLAARPRSLKGGGGGVSGYILGAHVSATMGPGVPVAVAAVAAAAASAQASKKAGGGG